MSFDRRGCTVVAAGDGPSAMDEDPVPAAWDEYPESDAASPRAGAVEETVTGVRRVLVLASRPASRARSSSSDT